MQIHMKDVGIVRVDKGDWVQLTGSKDSRFMVVQFAKVTSPRNKSVEWKVLANIVSATHVEPEKWFGNG